MGAQLTSYLAPRQAFSEGIESTAVLSGGTRRFTMPTLRARAVALPRAHQARVRTWARDCRAETWMARG
jgi:hypothetical protein